MKTKFVFLSFLLFFTLNSNINAQTSGDNPSDIGSMSDNSNPEKGPRRSKRAIVLEMNQVGHTLIFGSYFYGCEVELIGENGESFIFYVNDEDGIVLIPESFKGEYILNVYVGSSMLSTTIDL